jgi:sRNA-binding protein
MWGAMQAGAVRLDLTGAPAGTVDAEQAAVAAQKLADRKLKLKRRAALAKAAQPAPTRAPAPVQPKRISLADLREAAAARKAVA